MSRATDRAAIYAAELGIAQSGRDARASLGRAAAALRTRMARPATLALAAGLLGFWLARRPKPQAVSSSTSTNVASKASAASLVGALIVRYAMPYLPLVVAQVRAAQQERAARLTDSRA